MKPTQITQLHLRRLGLLLFVSGLGLAGCSPAEPTLTQIEDEFAESVRQNMERCETAIEMVREHASPDFAYPTEFELVTSVLKEYPRDSIPALNFLEEGNAVTVLLTDSGMANRRDTDFVLRNDDLLAGWFFFSTVEEARAHLGAEPSVFLLRHYFQQIANIEYCVVLAPFETIEPELLPEEGGIKRYRLGAMRLNVFVVRIRDLQVVASMAIDAVNHPHAGGLGAPLIGVLDPAIDDRNQSTEEIIDRLYIRMYQRCHQFAMAILAATSDQVKAGYSLEHTESVYLVLPNKAGEATDKMLRD